MNAQETPKPVSQAQERMAVIRARDKARTARWDLDIAVFLFTILILVLILLFQGIGMEIVVPVSVFGLAMVWLVGWRRGRQLYQRFYDEELSRIHQTDKTVEETIEEKVQKALRERFR